MRKRKSWRDTVNKGREKKEKDEKSHGKRKERG